MNGPLRVGVLGCASIAWRRTLPALVADNRVAVVAVASREAGPARRFADAFGCEPVVGYAALLGRDDIDAVYVPLPIALHHEWVGRALLSGRHVLAEKPLATTEAAARELVELAEKERLVLQENFMFLRHSQHRTVLELVDGGAIGQLRSVSAAFGIPPLPSDDIRYRPELGGGALLDVGVYPIRAAQMLLREPLHVSGATLVRDPGSGVDVAGSALLFSDTGVSASVSFGMQHHYRNAYELWGSSGRITVDRVFTPPADWVPTVVVERAAGTERLNLPPDDQFASVAAAFVTAVRANHGGNQAGAAGDLDLSGPGIDNGGPAIVRQAALVDAVRAAATVG